ncbi:uncharacterized protein PgNI_08026 [Pyricularia grisea]|uniref:Uncharacterized protein n=1 Tax=Pyricularia grisea TaxID=148305 RepID=A0A6P8AWD8_PYRGI|nr:uncharacterized protein PgNI_08026 [Pyricularia grisea]TLD06515.1 hypothetical protein PgNI_08026 [Pyricularia grisea]
MGSHQNQVDHIKLKLRPALSAILLRQTRKYLLPWTARFVVTLIFAKAASTRGESRNGDHILLNIPSALDCVANPRIVNDCRLLQLGVVGNISCGECRQIITQGEFYRKSPPPPSSGLPWPFG